MNARDRIAFSSNTIGGQHSAYIPSVNLVNTTFAVMQMKTQGSWDTSVVEGDGFVVNEGWGANMIDRIIYYLGSSSVANVQLSGEGNLFAILAQCETLEKKNFWLRKMGAFLFAVHGYSTPDSALAKPVANAELFRSRFDQTADTYGNEISLGVKDSSLGTAIVPLRLPWSSLVALEKRLSFDTKLLTQPILVSLYTRPFPVAYQQGIVNYDFDSFEEFTLQSQMQELSDKSLSLRDELLAAPDFNVGLRTVFFTILIR